MILTVTLNPALDVTYTVDAISAHATHRVRHVVSQPGGKGVNVARILHAVGEPVLVTGLLGGVTGAFVMTQLDAAGVPVSFVRIQGECRRTVTVVDAGEATGFWEPGPTVTPAEWGRFVEHYAALVRLARVVVLSGSLPTGLPADAYAVLIRTAAAHRVRTILDSSGEALWLGIAARPDIAKPDAEELAERLAATATVVSHPCIGDDDVGPARQVLRLGARAVVVSHGRRGLVGLTGDQAWRVAAPEAITGNAAGAGDACVAALARALHDGTPWPAPLADAVAMSAAAAGAPVAGVVDQDTYCRLRPYIAATAQAAT
ncbi:tagatose 6-phosphate kinase [Krasilnikovia cinnamomea]|uniref:Tagatose 6-phosphate kinase n=1 Tax=Krasilnikovia cinnamomea TaxID=349313 RepID=A0A4Q7ZQU5_9ACTN|nr:1-phosphofructokinase family hexose kinase [Krasilnikovia cinnamomea]RZU53508.1 tagatose 6-phosphate kinase [Krasilnikovia cinnamomea]